MPKIGAAAILALVTLAAAQDCAPESSQCHGSEDSMKKACCDGFSCIQKDEWYGQCLPTGTPAPDGWDGKIVDYSTGELTAEEPVEDNVDELEDTGAPMPASDPDEDTIEDEDDGVAPMQTTGAAVPIAALGDVSYMAFTAKDYLPTGSVPKMVAVEVCVPINLPPLLSSF
jgi:hypothetical protein